jgi:hypothetical protein
LHGTSCRAEPDSTDAVKHRWFVEPNLKPPALWIFFTSSFGPLGSASWRN